MVVLVKMMIALLPRVMKQKEIGIEMGAPAFITEEILTKTK